MKGERAFGARPEPETTRGDAPVLQTVLSSLLRWLKPRRSVVLFWMIDLTVPPDRRRHRMLASSGLEHPVEEVGPESDRDAILVTAQHARLAITEAAARLARGAHCLGLVSNGNTATTCWVSAGPEWVGELGGWFIPSRHEAYVWDCLTRPIYRGRHFYPVLLAEILDRLAAAGFQRVWIGTEWDNWRSARGVTRAGFRPVGAIVSTRVAFWRWHRVVADPTAPPALVEALAARFALRNCLTTAD